eukprot:gnl/TRDRNA2_/TRDRNA2_104570_c0_seq1.p1 gnl/TRDRNA2_/TRDRNA2_104570_c0~~gnl/TRDRNA2_/TRDRNA2_104570_c0_seq1.p1  ORF type:complete len:247 (+),score=51.20 gnl/TRDRNA2_/TRDRNA2_104570_c0_seq1:35-775(+)
MRHHKHQWGTYFVSGIRAYNTKAWEEHARIFDEAGSLQEQLTHRGLILGHIQDGDLDSTALLKGQSQAIPQCCSCDGCNGCLAAPDRQLYVSKTIHKYFPKHIETESPTELPPLPTPNMTWLEWRREHGTYNSRKRKRLKERLRKLKEREQKEREEEKEQKRKERMERKERGEEVSESEEDEEEAEKNEEITTTSMPSTMMLSTLPPEWKTTTLLMTGDEMMPTTTKKRRPFHDCCEICCEEDHFR